MREDIEKSHTIRSKAPNIVQQLERIIYNHDQSKRVRTQKENAIIATADSSDSVPRNASYLCDFGWLWILKNGFASDDPRIVDFSWRYEIAYSNEKNVINRCNSDNASNHDDCEYINSNGTRYVHGFRMLIKLEIIQYDQNCKRNNAKLKEIEEECRRHNQKFVIE